MFRIFFEKNTVFNQVILFVVFLIIYFIDKNPTEWALNQWITFGCMLLILIYVTHFLILTKAFNHPLYALFAWLTWWVCFSKYFVDPQFVGGFLFLNVFLIELFTLEESETPQYKYLGMGALYFIAFALWPKAILFGILPLLFLFNIFGFIRNFIAYFFGILLAAIILFCALFLMDSFSLLTQYEQALCVDLIGGGKYLFFLIPFFVLGLAGIIMVLSKLNQSGDEQNRLFFKALIVYTLLIIWVIFFSGEQLQLMALMGLPLAYWMGRLFNGVKLYWLKYLLWLIFVVNAIFFFFIINYPNYRIQF